MTALVWFRRDLRLTDNPAWATATNDHRGVEAIFVLDRRLFGPAGGPRRDLLLGHLHALDGELRQRGGRLTFAAGSPEEVIPVAARVVALGGGKENSPRSSTIEELPPKRPQKNAKRKRQQSSQL